MDYKATASRATAMIKANGAAIRLTRVAAGDYNPDTSEVEGGTKRYDGWGAKFDYESRQIDGTSILAGDVRILLAVDGLPRPLPGDLITMAPDTAAAETWRVIRPKTTEPALIPVMHEVQARK